MGGGVIYAIACRTIPTLFFKRYLFSLSISAFCQFLYHADRTEIVTSKYINLNVIFDLLEDFVKK